MKTDCSHCGADEFYRSTDKRRHTDICASCGSVWKAIGLGLTEPAGKRYTDFAAALDKTLLNKKPVRFAWGRFREAVDKAGIRPDNANWFGVWARTRLLQHGYKPVGAVGRSSVESRNGGTERYYERAA